MPEFQIEREDGETITVDTDELMNLPDGFSLNTPDAAAEGYVTETFHQASVEQATEGLLSPDDATQNDAVVRAILSEHSDEEVDLDEHRNQWRQDELEPLKNKHTQLLNRLKASEIIEAGRQAGVREEYLEDGSESYLAYKIADQLEYDEKHGLVAKGEDGKRLPGSEDRTFASATDLLGRMKDSGNNENLFQGQTPQGEGGSYQGGTGGEGGSITSKGDFDSVVAKVEWIDENGQEAYNDLPDE